MRIVHLLIVCMLYISSAKAWGTDTRIALDKELAALKKADKLSDWIYARIAYSAEKPHERLAFLMTTGTEVWRKPGTGPEKEAWLNLLVNQGYYQLYTGDILKSIEQYERAYAFFQKHPVNGFDLVEYIFKPLGNNYTRLGDYSNAIYIQQKGLSIAVSRKDSLAIASIYSNLAISYKSMGDLKAADKMCATAFNYLKQQHPITGLLYNTRADILYEEGQYSRAAQNVQLALKILVKNPENAYWLLSAYTLAGNIAQKQGRFGKASQFYNKGISLINHQYAGSRRREKANLLIQSGNVTILENRPQTALQYYNKALKVLMPRFTVKNIRSLPAAGDLYSENRLYEALEGRAQALALMNFKADALDNYLLALTAGDKSRNEFASPKDRIAYQAQAKKLAEVALNLAFELWMKRGNAKYSQAILHIAEHTKARTLFDRMQSSQRALARKNHPLLKQEEVLKRAIIYYEKDYLVNTRNVTAIKLKQEAEYKLAILEKEIKKTYPAWDPQETELGTKELLNQIPPQFGVINFFWGENNVFIIKARKGAVDTIIRLDHAKALKVKIDTYIQTYFKNGPAAMGNNPEKYYAGSHGIYKGLFAGVVKDNKHNRLVIIPDDILGYLPVESLITSEHYTPAITKWPFLINKKSLSYAYSLQTWLKRKSRQSSSTSFSGFFISKSEKNTSIPAVKVEAETLEEHIQGSFFNDQEASIQNFKEALNTSKVLHLSTHAYLFGRDAEPVLQLSDGKFFLFELAVQNKAPRLVVLSACRTADGIMATGEGVLSLSRGFTAAGTAGVVAGLWNINDAASSQLVLSFYENLQKGRDAAIALHEAKTEWLQREHGNPALSLPYYWSSLIYIGEPQVIRLEPANNNKLAYLLLAAMVAVITVAVMLVRKRLRRAPSQRNL